MIIGQVVTAYWVIGSHDPLVVASSIQLQLGGYSLTPFESVAHALKSMDMQGTLALLKEPETAENVPADFLTKSEGAWYAPLFLMAPGKGHALDPPQPHSGRIQPWGPMVVSGGIEPDWAQPMVTVESEPLFTYTRLEA